MRPETSLLGGGHRSTFSKKEPRRGWPKAGLRPVGCKLCGSPHAHPGTVCGA